MILSLLKYNIKTNRALFISMVIVMLFYYLIIMSMFDPASVDALNNMLELMPKEMIDALGFNNFGSTLLTFIVGYIYGFLVYLFPMVITIVVNHKLVASLVDKGSMAYILSSPNSRLKVIVTQCITSLLNVTIFFTLITLLTSLVAELMFPGQMDYWMYFKINVYNLIQFYAISAIVFFGSSFASDSKTSLTIGVGVPIAFLVIQMLGNVGDKFSWMSNLTMYTLFDAEKMIAGDSFVYLGMVGFTVIAFALYSAAIYIFNKKNLYI